MAERERSSFLFPAAVLVALPVLYVLSIGPVAAMIDAGWIGPALISVLQVVYWPLGVLDNHSEALHALFQWYMSLWGV